MKLNNVSNNNLIRNDSNEEKKILNEKEVNV